MSAGGLATSQSHRVKSVNNGKVMAAEAKIGWQKSKATSNEK
jgi:hypothetical protein